MNKKPTPQDTLQHKAEARLALTRVTDATAHSAEKLLHDLHVHQIELEMQNEELRRTQVALEEARDRYVDLYEFAPVGYLTLSQRGVITAINLTGAAMLGAERKALLQHHFAHLIAREHAGQWQPYFTRVMQQEDSLPCELSLRRGDGSFFYAHLDSRSAGSCPISDNHGLSTHRSATEEGATETIRITLTDISHHKLLEEERMLSNQRLNDQQFYTRSLIEASLDALMTTDPAGIITDVNKQMEKLTGCTRDELIGAPFKNYFTDPERAETSIKLVLLKQRITDYELTARTREGRETIVSYNATTFYDRHRKLQGVFVAARDITERKRLDEVLKKKKIELENAKLIAEKANLAKSVFLSSMSHELRTPLNAILGFAQLLEAATPPPTETQAVRVQQIIKAGWYLLELINEVLDLAVIESGKLSLVHEPVALTDIMSDCLTMIEPQAQQRSIRIELAPFDPAWFAYADPTRLKQVLLNLLANAIKYNSERGTIAVLCSLSAPDRIRITIKDSGTGLPPEKLEQLFQPFNRLGQENGREEGTGIGLVMAKRLIELMGGAIGATSRIGMGSEFWIELARTVAPLPAPASTSPEKRAAPAAGNTHTDAAAQTLLYVDDNPDNLMLVEQLIARHPHWRILSAADGYAGIALARARLPDVVLMDINLPGIGGIEAMNILREDPATAHIPVIALSASAMLHDIRAGLKAGFFRYICKPIKLDELMNALNDAMKLSESGSPKTSKTGEMR